jgi:dipeptidyl aminopeptidase/acylaminoacyl peptidase
MKVAIDVEAEAGVGLLRVTQQGDVKPPLRLLLMVALMLLWFVPFSRQGLAQNLDKPVMNVDEEVTAFAYAPDGRIVFSVRRMFKNKKYDMQRDDIFIAEANGKRRRILEGQKFTHGDKPFTYQVESFTWSPNGHNIAVQLFTTTVDPEDEHHDDTRALLLLDDSGHELHPKGPDALVTEAEQPMWLRDNGTLVYMTEEISTRELFSMHYLYISGGPETKAFEGRTFSAAVRIPGSNSAIAIERDRNMEGPARMQRLELLAQEDKELATLDGYYGGLSVSPSGTKAAYFLDREVLEVRDLEKPSRVARMRVGLGVVQWNAEETEIYVKRTVEKKSADLVSFQVPQLVAFQKNQVVPVTEPEPRQLLHGLAVREYGLSADGRYLAVVLPGKRNLQVFGF